MKTVIIVQARMTSTRLPGKILKTVLGKPLLDFQFDRLARVSRADESMIATTTNATDDAVVEFCRSRGLPFFRGSEDDVLSRYHGAAVQAKADVIVRITSDCPLIDPEVVDEVIGSFGSGDDCDYASNTLERTYPRGLDCEVFSLKSLERAHREAAKASEREHVTPYIWGHPEIFRLRSVRNARDLSALRWTVDTEEDFRLIQNLLEAVFPGKPRFTTADLLASLQAHPDWARINAHIEQKKTAP